jgi:hypothetical protein
LQTNITRFLLTMTRKNYKLSSFLAGGSISSLP